MFNLKARTISSRRVLPAACVLLSLTVIRLSAAETERAETAERNVDGIMDNSSFVEEAYNQEPVVVQHIGTLFYNVNRRPGPDDEAWELAFTQEWPVFSQTHQFSYSVPYNFVRSGGQSVDGLGDLEVTYRFQAYFD